MDTGATLHGPRSKHGRQVRITLPTCPVSGEVVFGPLSKRFESLMTSTSSGTCRSASTTYGSEEGCPDERPRGRRLARQRAAPGRPDHRPALPPHDRREGSPG